jgi:hypothetical protein
VIKSFAEMKTRALFETGTSRRFRWESDGVYDVEIVDYH